MGTVVVDIGVLTPLRNCVEDDVGVDQASEQAAEKDGKKGKQNRPGKTQSANREILKK
jgi:hypothetical protein